MILFVILGIAVLSVLMALFSLWRQTKMEEIKRAQKALKRERVIFHSGS